jgi:hypothetical protein
MSAQPITAWSFSRWTTYESCPLKAKFLYVDKLKEPDSSAQARGTAIHKLAEDYTTGKIKTLPGELKAFATEFKKLRGLKPQVELQWAFTSSWSPTGWFDKNAWCRIKLDVLVMKHGQYVLVDHKTGRQYPEHIEQLELYALGGFCSISEAQEIEAQDWYLDVEKLTKGQDRILGEDFKRDQLTELKDLWASRTRAMLLDLRFDPKPSDKCRFCHFRKVNGGPCQY